MIRAALSILVLVATTMPAHAGGCYPSVVKQAVVAQPVYSYAFYFVGQPVREQAVMQKAVQADPLWREFQEFKAWREQYNAQLPAAAQAIHSTVLQATCVKCHSGAEPKGDVRLDGELTDALKLRAMGMVWQGKMPPTGPLANEKAAELFEELLGSQEPQPERR